MSAMVQSKGLCDVCAMRECVIIQFMMATYLRKFTVLFKDPQIKVLSDMGGVNWRNRLI